MSNNETRISNERLAATIQRLIGKGNAMVGYMDSPEAIEAGAATSLASWQRETEAAMGMALEALRSTPVEADHIDAAIRLTKQIEGVFYHDHPGGAVQVRAKVQLMLAEALAHPLPNPSPSDGEVSDKIGVLHLSLWQGEIDAFDAEYGKHIIGMEYERGNCDTRREELRETRIDTLREVTPILRHTLHSSKRGQP